MRRTKRTKTGAKKTRMTNGTETDRLKMTIERRVLWMQGLNRLGRTRACHGVRLRGGTLVGSGSRAHPRTCSPGRGRSAAGA